MLSKNTAFSQLNKSFFYRTLQLKVPVRAKSICQSFIRMVKVFIEIYLKFHFKYKNDFFSAKSCVNGVEDEPKNNERLKVIKSFNE